MMNILKRIPTWIWIGALYLGSHLPSLLLLPVFADEAIYIRWAQLVIDDASRYAFFSMSDGKPPLFIWLLSLTLRFGQNPLWVGRFTSVVIGLITVFVISKFAFLLTGSKRIAQYSAVITIFAPFWWFYHRMALMDGLLTLLVMLSLYFSAKIAIACQKESGIAYDMIPSVLLLGLSFGGALLTKTPALFAIPSIALMPLLSLTKVRGRNTRSSRQKLYESVLLIGLGGIFGFVCFGLLKVSPFFGALFTRSGDFTFTVKELVAGEWRYVFLKSFPREIFWISMYMSMAAIVAAIFGACISPKRRTVYFLLLSAISFGAPLILFGRVLYPRYFLPVAPFLTIAAAIGFRALWKQEKMRVVAYVLFAALILQSALFLIPSVSNVASIPFVPIDRMQYLEEWSAGFGNTQVVQYIQTRRNLHSSAGQPKIIVLTEGSFGTLPDGILMYFYGSNQLQNVEIHGIGVSPQTIPPEYLSQAETSEVYYAVNSHRLGIIDRSKLEKIFEVARPNNSPSLLFFRIQPK